MYLPAGIMIGNIEGNKDWLTEKPYATCSPTYLYMSARYLIWDCLRKQ